MLIKHRPGPNQVVPRVNCEDKILANPTLADAICDWLLHNAYKVEMRGDSMRVINPVRENKLS